MTTRPPRGISPGELRLDQVFRDREGTMTQKALVLQQMLDTLDIESSIGLTGSRVSGVIDTTVIDPTQFNATIVVAQVGGERVFLDPSDPRLGYGVMSPELAGMPCLLLDERGETWVETPALDAATSRRSATVHLVVSEDGRVVGAGTLVLTGYHAVRALKVQPTDEGARYAWQSWFERRMPGFIIGDVSVDEDVEATRVEVRWRQLLREEQVLLDEVVLAVADPLTLERNPFTLEADERSTPVLLAFPDSSEVLLEVRWPKPWRLDGSPHLRAFHHSLGSLESESTIEPDLGRAVVRRAFTVNRRLVEHDDYAALRQLYSETVANDAEQLVLVAGRDGS
jgi:hypothetical protein